MRPTSIQAYEAARSSGLLSRLRLTVFWICCKHCPATANEIMQYAPRLSNSGVYGTRLSELEKMGVLTTIGVRPCKITGKNAMVWDITGNSPAKMPKQKTRGQKKNDLIAYLGDRKEKFGLYDLYLFDELKSKIKAL